MNRRSFAALALGLSLIASPVLAKDKQPATVAPAPLSAVVSTDVSVDPDNILVLDLSNGGRVMIRLMPAWAPGHVERIKTLTKQGFYNGIIFHRVIDGFMAQTGDPTGTGQGGSQLPDLKAEFNFLPHVRGTVSMARTDQPDTANSQFFIMRQAYPSLDKRYTVWGRAVVGLDVVRALSHGSDSSGAVTEPDTMIRVQVASDIPEAERPTVRVLSTTSQAFRDLVEQVRSARGADFSLCDIDLPAGMRFGAIYRDGAVIKPDGSMVIRPHDRVIIFAMSAAVRQVEQMFRVSLEFF